LPFDGYGSVSESIRTSPDLCIDDNGRELDIIRTQSSIDKKRKYEDDELEDGNSME